MEASLSRSTQSTYSSGFQCFLTFLTMSGVVFTRSSLPMPTEDLLVYFVTYCARSLKLQWCTIKLYLAGVRHHYLKAGFSNPLLQCDRLYMVLRGIKKSQVSKSKVRLPITADILFRMCGALQNGIFNPTLDFTLQCMFLIAFYGFLRCGEFTVRSTVEDYLTIGHITFAEDLSHLSLLLPTSKTDPFRQGVVIPIYRKHKWCPVSFVKRYFNLRTNSVRGGERSAPLFVENMWELKPFSRDRFLEYLQQVLTRAGFDASKYSGHSFRGGAASTAAANNVEDHLIKTLGRWSSSCYTRYIKVQPDILRNAQNRLCQ